MLNRAAKGDRSAAAALLPMIYDDLRAAAGALFQAQRAGHTLQPTALVHEAYLRLVKAEDATYENRRHFIAVAATAMRQVLTSHARGVRSLKRGGGAKRIPLLESETSVSTRPPDELYAVDVVKLDDALTELATFNARQAEIVTLRFLGGLSTSDIAEHLGVSQRTVELGWRMARAWLRSRLSEAAA